MLQFEFSLAFGALFRIDHVGLSLELDRAGGTFELTGTALGALGCDDPEGHFQLLVLME
ncbi:hypothetical protein J2Z50_003161 [Ensifer mexicanus]|nr:hypothetical protein [Sinorhizobium mexicanum]